MIPDYEPSSSPPPPTAAWWIRVLKRITSIEPFMLDGKREELSPRERAELQRRLADIKEPQR